jgi:putative pre-16S rRNA nuclease
MRYLGLDIGSHRIGVALSDELATIAQPLLVLPADSSADKIVSQIGDLCDEHEVTKVVIGLPLSLSGGSRGKSARRAQQVGRRIEDKLGLTVIYWDERFTTTEAERALIEGNVRRSERRKKIDKVAAALILQGYLDSRGTIE